jgi:hypothetical protein
MKSIYCFKTIPALFASLLALNGCSILVGQVRPVDKKADSEKLLDVSKIDPDWKKLKQDQAHANAEDIPDAAWQSSKTAAIISLNSACRQSSAEGNEEPTDLRSITETLLSQWRSLKVKNERELIVSGYPALETTAIGFYLNQTRKFQTVAIKTSSCVFDLIFLSPVETFDQEISVFQKFRDSLKFK